MWSGRRFCLIIELTKQASIFMKFVVWRLLWLWGSSLVELSGEKKRVETTLTSNFIGNVCKSGTKNIPTFVREMNSLAIVCMYLSSLSIPITARSVFLRPLPPYHSFLQQTHTRTHFGRSPLASLFCALIMSTVFILVMVFCAYVCCVSVRVCVCVSQIRANGINVISNMSHT